MDEGEVEGEVEAGEVVEDEVEGLVEEEEDELEAFQCMQ